MNILGNIVSHLWWGGDPDEKNPISDMSRRDVYNIQKSWQKINADGSKYGFMMFSRLFQTDPESKTYFPYLSGAGEEQMSRNVTFQAHIVFIVASLNTAVDVLPQPEIVVPLMTKLGRSHRRQGVRRKHFRVFKEVLLTILREELGCGADVVWSWTLFIDFMYKHMFTAVQE